MRISDLFAYGNKIFLLALLLLLVFSIAFAIGYFLYKKVRPDTKPLNKRFLLLLAVTLGYFICLFGAVFLTRGAHYQSLSIQIHPFRAYRNAWYHFSMVEWRNIIINILLFVPLGLLLPLYTKKLQRIIPVLLLGLSLTLFIEFTQFITHRGIFEVDDLINNTLGAIIGYGLISFILSIKKKGVLLKLAYLAPLLATICLFISIFAIYEQQELGNLSSTYLVPTKMKEVDLTTDFSFSDQSETATVYQASYASLEDATASANALFTHKNLTIDHSRTLPYENSVLFYSAESSFHLWMNYAGLTYDYTDFSKFDEGMVQKEIEEFDLRERLKTDFNLEIPQNAIFSGQDNGFYRFDLTNDLQEDILWNGFVEISYYNDDTIKSLRNNLIPYRPYQDYTIISPLAAYHQIQEGKFPSYETLKSLHIKDVVLSYEMDTKGFYQPVYLFRVILNGEENQIRIAAIE